MQNVLAILLAGGAGERLHPLTQFTAKPAVPFGGTYRIIDFTLYNCINSDVRRIFILTQYKSLELNRHVRDGWNILSPELQEVVWAQGSYKLDGGTSDVPYYGYDGNGPFVPTSFTAPIAEAQKTGRGILEIVRERKILTEQQIAEVLDPMAMTGQRRPS